MTTRILSYYRKNQIEPLFKEHDKDNNGYVTVDQAKEVLKKKFPDFEDDQIGDIAQQYDKDKKDQCNYGDIVLTYAHLKTK